MDRYCKALELDKVLARLERLCCCADSKALAAGRPFKSAKVLSMSSLRSRS